VWPLARPMIRRLTRKMIRDLEAFVISRQGVKSLPS
jgi:hypothetical protein